MGIMEIPEKTLCANCCGREADEYFSEHISAMDMAHGEYGQPWCNHCIIPRQLEFAQEMAAKVGDLTVKLIRLESEEDKV